MGSDPHMLRNVLLLLAVVVLWYVVVCTLYPYKTCRHCDGGKTKTPSRKAFRICWWCNGFGGRARIGTRVWRRLRQTSAEKIKRPRA